MKLEISVLKSLLINPQLDHKKQNFYCQCPWCGTDEFGISIKEGHRFGCFRKAKCGESGNIFKYLMKIGRMDVLREFSLTLNFSDKLVNVIEEKELENKLDLELPTINLPFGLTRVYQHPYLTERNVTNTERDKFFVTDFNPEFENYIIASVEQYGEVKGYVARHFWKKKKIDKWNKMYPDEKIKRYNNSHSEFSKMIYGLEEITDNTTTVILVEGIFDKKNIDTILDLDSQEEIKCGCSFGAKLSREQIFLLRIHNIKRVILMFDPDVINKIKAHALDLDNYFEEVMIGIHKTKDPGDFLLSDVEEVLDKLESPISFFLNKVQVLDLK